MIALLDRIAPSFRKPALALPAACAEWLRRQEIRKAYGQLSAEELRDIGLTAHDLDAALRLPWAKSASASLADVAARRAGQW